MGSMESLQIFILLMAAAVLLVETAQKIRVPYPITLILGGAAIGFIPGMQKIHFQSQPNFIGRAAAHPILCGILDLKS